MVVRHVNGMLERLECEDLPKTGFSVDLIKAFRRRMQFIRAAKDERDFYAFKSLHYEKLKGARAGQRSMRLNDQFRLVIQLAEQKSEKVVVVLSVEDYH